MRYSVCFVLAIGMITLGSCGKPPPLTTAEDQRIDRAMARVKVEQDRTDRAIAAEMQQERSIDAMPIIEVRGHLVQQNNLGQHSPPDIQIPPSSGNIIADSSRTGN